MGMNLFSIHSVLTSAQVNKSSSKPQGRVIVFGKKDLAQLSRLLKGELGQWQLERCRSRPKTRLETRKGPVWVLNLWVEAHLHSPQDVNEASSYSVARDLLGATYASAVSEDLNTINLCFVGCQSEQIMGGLVGVEMGSYKYKNWPPQKKDFQLYVNKLEGVLTSREVTKASALGVAVNLARHLVNIPPAQLHPRAYASTVQSLFREKVQVEIWNESRLKKENMGLLVGVGQELSTNPVWYTLNIDQPGPEGSPLPLLERESPLIREGSI